MPRYRRHCRRGGSALALLGACAAIVALPIAAWRLSARILGVETEKMPLMVTVERADFRHEILVRGELESSVNAEVACEVRGGYEPLWTSKILELIPEGTYVQPGDFLARLDVKYHEDKVASYLGYVEKARAYVSIAEARLEMARTELHEYRKGTYPLAQNLKDQKVFTSEEDLRTATEAYDFSKKLLREGIITQQQLEADHFAVQSAEKKLERANVSSEVLRKYTRDKVVLDTQGEIAAAEAYLLMRQRLYKHYLSNLEEYKEQIAKGVVTAPVAGEVVYNHQDHITHWHMVEPGQKTYNGKVIIRLPDPKQMQVKTLIAEDQISQVRVGMSATLSLDSLPGVALTGTVNKVSEIPEAESFFGSARKQFETLVTVNPESVEAASAELRPGLTADLRILSDQRGDELQVPFQAILSHGKRRYCLTVERGDWKAHEVQVGPSNGSFVVVEKGLSEGQQVVLAAEAHRDEIEWPDLSPEEQSEQTAVKAGNKPTNRAAKQRPAQPGRDA